MKQSELAEQIARKAHAGQFRRDGVTPYIKHVEAVVSRLEGEDDDVIAAAWLHDVIEDTDITIGFLVSCGISVSVQRAVFILSKNMHAQPYEAYIKSIKQNPIARKVKIADMLSNLADKPTNSQIRRYAKALLELVED